MRKLLALLGAELIFGTAQAGNIVIASIGAGSTIAGVVRFKSLPGTQGRVAS